MKKTLDKKVALFCGAYKLPLLTRDALRAAGFDVFVIGLRGFYDPALKPDMEIRLGGGGAAARECDKRGIKQLCFVGAVNHLPKWHELRPDLWSMSIAASVLKNRRGHDSMVTTFINALEKKGYRVVAAQDLAPDLVFQPGVQTKTRVLKNELKNIERGIEVAHIIGRADIGQSVVVDGEVVALEAAEGTRMMLRRVLEIAHDRPRGGVFVKMTKPQQDLRIDIPAIGVETVRDVIAAKLAGIVVDAGTCFVIDRAEVLALADKHKIFIVAK